MESSEPFGPDRWVPEIRDRFLAKTHHQFILHQNIFDYVKPRQGPRPLLMSYIVDHANAWAPEAFDIVVSFAPSVGLKFYPERSAAPGAAKAQVPAMEARFRELSGMAADMPLAIPGEKAFPLLERVLQDRKARLLLIVRYLENVAPASRTNYAAASPVLIETLHRWGLDGEIRACGHMILMLTYNLGQVDESLYAANSGCYAVPIALPNEQERLAYLQFVQDRPSGTGLAALEGDMRTANLAQATTGFSLRALEEMNGLAVQRQLQITWAVVRQRKEEIIRAESEGLLEVSEADHGFADVGGLTKVKQYLQDVATQLKKDRRSPVIPKGLLFVGPPGVGKTHIAQAFARESDMNFVVMRNVRSKWVGESERNLTRVFNLARSIAPVCVFVDEVDQALGGRGVGGGDSGVSQRIFGRILEEMGDNRNRGNLLWICATNRPDFMDPAMISRFDRVIPFLLPISEERVEIMRALLNYLHIHAPSTLDLQEAAARMEGFTGREMEIILRRALEICGGGDLTQEGLGQAIDDFKPNHDQLQYKLQALLAIRSTNLRHFLPDKGPYDEILAQGRIDQNLLDREISSIMYRSASFATA